MIKKIFLYTCFLFFTNIYMLFASKDSNEVKIHRFILHHEILSPVIYPSILGGDNSAQNVVAWKYFTGGLRYKVSRKHEIGLDYLFFEKQFNSKDPGDEIMGFGSIVNPNFGYEAEKHIYQQKYMWMYYRLNLKNFFVSCGFGGGIYSYSNNSKYNSAFEKNSDWCNVFDLGYSIKIFNNIRICPYLGMLNAFSFKKEITYAKPIGYSSEIIYNYEVEQFRDLKKVEITNSNHISRTYKNLGIMQSKIIPRLGISLILQF